MRRLNPVWLLVFSTGLITVPSFGVGLAVVESRNSEVVIQEPLIQESHEEPFERTRQSDVSARSYGNKPSYSNSSEDRAARLTLKQVESLQRDVSELRGLVETQDHEIARLKKSQQDFYLDLDKRLSQAQQASNKPTDDKTKRTSIYAAPDKAAAKAEAKSDTKREPSAKAPTSTNASPTAKSLPPPRQIGTIPTAPPKAIQNKPVPLLIQFNI